MFTPTCPDTRIHNTGLLLHCSLNQKPCMLRQTGACKPIFHWTIFVYSCTVSDIFSNNKVFFLLRSFITLRFATCISMGKKRISLRFNFKKFLWVPKRQAVYHLGRIDLKISVWISLDKFWFWFFNILILHLRWGLQSSPRSPCGSTLVRRCFFLCMDR